MEQGRKIERAIEMLEAATEDNRRGLEAAVSYPSTGHRHVTNDTKGRRGIQKGGRQSQATGLN